MALADVNKPGIGVPFPVLRSPFPQRRPIGPSHRPSRETRASAPVSLLIAGRWDARDLEARPGDFRALVGPAGGTPGRGDRVLLDLLPDAAHHDRGAHRR